MCRIILIWLGFEQRQGLIRHMYNMLTSVYAALYKTTSILTFDWRSKEVSEMLGHDGKLIQAFCDIKTEMFWFRKSYNLSRGDHRAYFIRCKQRYTDA